MLDFEFFQISTSELLVSIIKIMLKKGSDKVYLSDIIYSANMKNTTFRTLALLFVLFMSFNDSFSQQINPKIEELLGDKTQEIIQNDPERIKVLNDLLENRIKIMESPVVGEDKYTKLSTVPLANKYNPSIQRDIVFDPATFNPLKYNMNFFTSQTQIYRVDNTDYLIVIQQQQTK